MAESMSGRSRILTRSLLFALAATSLLLVGCGAQDAQDDKSSPRTAAGVDATPKPASEQTAGTDQSEMKKNAQAAQDERAANAPSGDPVAPAKTGVPKPEDYGYGAVAATAGDGEVIAYVPRLEGGRLVVPLTIQNKGNKRAAYMVTVVAEGPSGSSPVTVKASNTFPGTTWPTQAEITAAGVKNPKAVKITLKVIKDIYPYGDSH
ncbi:hypothetical protein ACFCYX_18345 [Streptomyces populi]|uniref:hypothetical protein n=1 Tax=Streptomyces populi TaxID=2058924 RepID=UPI0013A695B4|nr:hypothetical protein [Streptomyces populi]